jgi:aminotransferase
MIASMLGIIDPGDEVVIFEPFYENYGPDAIISGAVPRFVTLHPPDWTFDEADLRAAFSDRTRGIVINTPNNPTGKVYSREELTLVAELCQRHDAVAFTDEIYEHILYDGAEHIPIASIPGMEDRTVTIGALSKTYSVTGWRVGWALASHDLMDGIRKVHDFLTVAAATPLQVAGATALAMPDGYYRDMAKDYAERRDLMMRILDDCGFKADSPKGAYYVMADVSRLGLGDDVATAHHLVEHAQVATVPGSSFFSDPSDGAHLLRFAFCKRLETLEAAGERLRSAAG